MSTASRPEPGSAELLAALVDIPSESGEEAAVADLVTDRLAGVAGLDVERDGNIVLARTGRGTAGRVLLAGHLDTVPVAGNLPSRRDGSRLYGCGASDMKAGVAVMVALAVGCAGFARDVTFVFYDCEEVSAGRNGLGRLARDRPAWLAADLAILLEPTGGVVEAGCQGTLRAVVTTEGVRAHTARAWLGSNAIHSAGPLLERLRGHSARTVEIDGCRYREGLSAVAIHGGAAGNVVPDRCELTLNLRFAPDRSRADAEGVVAEVAGDLAFVVDDFAPGALPRLAEPAVADFLAAAGGEPRAKLGWTDVARFAELGIPALNYGPGDPELAHTAGEWVDLELVERCRTVLARYLSVQ